MRTSGTVNVVSGGLVARGAAPYDSRRAAKITNAGKKASREGGRRSHKGSSYRGRK